MPTETLTNPYDSLPPERLVRVALWISVDDHGYLKSLHPRTSLWQHSLATFLHSIANELRSAKITGLSPDTQSLVQSLIRQRCAPVGSVADAVVSDDAGRVDGLHTTRPGDDKQPTNPVSGAKGRKRTGKKGDGSGKGKSVS